MMKKLEKSLDFKRPIEEVIMLNKDIINLSKKDILKMCLKKENEYFNILKHNSYNSK